MTWLEGAFGWHDAFGNASYILIAVSYYLTRMLWLRAVAVVGLGFEILYFGFSGGQLMTGIGWNVVFIAINLYQLWQLLRCACGSRRAEELAELRNVLLGLDDTQLGRLFRAGCWRDLASGDALTEEGRAVPALFLLCRGHAVVEVEGKIVAQLAPGSFVGEMAFLSGNPASATVRAAAAARVFAIESLKLRKLIAGDEQFSAAVHRAVGQDLAQKLDRLSHARMSLAA